MLTRDLSMSRSSERLAAGCAAAAKNAAATASGGRRTEDRPGTQH